jgi:hypothetical protein
MADTEEINITHQIDKNNSIELEEIKTTGQPLESEIILTHQINPDTSIEIDHDNRGDSTVELNIKI